MKSLPLAALLLGGVIGGALGASALSAGPMPEMPDVLRGMIPAGGGVGPSHHGGKAGPGGRGGPLGGLPMMQLAREIDTNSDRALTQEEVDAFVAGKTQLGDANSDGNLTLEEFQTVWLSIMRPLMVDRFQELDEDGDGAVTEAERSRRFGEIVAQLDRNGDGRLDRADYGRGRGHDRGDGRGDREGREERQERSGQPAPASPSPAAPAPAPAN